MSKNIVVCYDGTSYGVKDNSIIYQLYSNCVQKKHKQTVMYDTGVGTQLGFLRSIAGLLFGKGIRKNITEGLEFIQKNYVHGDRVYLFGYSRGAYTALLLSHALMSMDRGKTSIKVPVYFLGAFDTVASLGRIIGINLSTNKLPPNVKNALHLLAINEYRSKFDPVIWSGYVLPTVLQTWVKGSHSDLGGFGTDLIMSENYLKLMLKTSCKLGLKLTETLDFSHIVFNGKVKNTYKGFWKIWKKKTRRMF